ncbi:MAG: hypothetical protein K1Y02_00700 [Candidatus Hydrogenedentes bacterium]|nr:hypothetical protein [Candidatus Hydrogenedentota bacterium]
MNIVRLVRLTCCLSALCATALLASGEAHAVDSGPVPINRLAIVLEPDATPLETQDADVLKTRLLSVSNITIDIAKEPVSGADLQIFLGKSRPQGRLHDLCTTHAVTLPGRGSTLFPEGFAVRTIQESGRHAIVAVGVDDRAVLYAVGEIVRRFHYEADHVTLPSLNVSTAPAYRFRGFSPNQGGAMLRVAKARVWTDDEFHAVGLEYAMAGANLFYSPNEDCPYYRFLKSFGFMTETGVRPNQLRSEFPPEWKAGGREMWEGKDWVCPSVPEAHDALMKQWETDFAGRADHDVLRFFAGDPGGCTCERCTPWGNTFMHLCEELATKWKALHPNSIVMVANQGLDNAGDRAIFSFLRETPRTWCYGIAYGPGSNAMSPYFRDKEMRDDLFEYPGQGPVNRYLSEILNQLPGDQRIVHYSDITHWIRSQYEVENPEPNIVKAYGRRTFHARPVAMYRIFQSIMPFSEGDIIYSEGNHDEFHQYMWARLLWNPNRSLDDVMNEYCVLYFGEDAAPLMVQALLQLEKNLEAPLAENQGIKTYLDLVTEAGEKIPAWRMERDYRWRLHMQKALLDQYLQYKLRIELDKEQRARETLETSLTSGKIGKAIEQALQVLSEAAETPEMKALREQAGKLGNETERLHGDRNSGYFKLDIPLRDIPGIKAILEQAKSEKSKKKRIELVQAAIARSNEPTRPGNVYW